MSYCDELPDRMSDLVATLQLVTSAKIIANLTGKTDAEAMEQIKAESRLLAKSLTNKQLKD